MNSGIERSLPPPFRLFSAGFARAYVVTMRPYLCFVSGVTGLLGLSLGRDASSLTLVVAGVVFFLAYGFGQALTDVTQLDTDTLSAPQRPMVAGLVRARDVQLVSMLALVACALVLVALNPRIALLAPLPIAGLLTYTPMKRRFWAGPPWNAGVVATLPLLGALVGGRPLRLVLADAALHSRMATAFFAYLTFVLLGYLKDIEADRQTGYVTLPVRFGRRVTVSVSFICAVVAITTSWPSLPVNEFAASVLWLVGAALLVFAHVLAWRVRSDAQAYPAITVGLRGYIALLGGLATRAYPALFLVVLVMLAGFEMMQRRRPCRAQV
jgi:4-hydroxybenzoate polyprenyltransferase